MLEHRAGILQVLDRLQEHHRVSLPGEGLDQIACEPQVRTAVTQPRMLVRLGVGIDTDDACGSGGEHV